MTPSVCVVILNWNGTEDTLKCLRSVECVQYPALTVLVVDNGSTPDTLVPLRAGLGAANLMENGVNLGFALGNNRGIEWALDRGAAYILLLNNDTVVDPGCVAALVRVAEGDPSVGIVGAVNFYLSRPDIVWYSGGMVDWRTGHLNDPTCEKSLDELDGIPVLREVDDVAGSSLLIRASLVRGIGLLDPRYFMYYEETEWCVRARRRGYRVISSRDARIWHKVSGSAGPVARYFMVRNRGLFMMKNCPRRRLPGFLWRHFRSCLGEAWRSYRCGRRAEGMITALALRDFVLGRFDEGSLEAVRGLVAGVEA